MARMKLSFGQRQELRERLQVNERSVVEHSRIDEAVRDRLMAQSDRFRASSETVPEIKGEDYRPMPDLSADVFYAHLDTAPDVSVRQPAEVVPASALHSEVMQSFVRQEDFAAARATTRGDDVLSAVSAMAAHQVMVEGITEALARQPEPPQQQDQQDQQAGAQERIDGIREDVKDQGGQATPEQVQALKDAIAERNAAEDALGSDPQAGAPASSIAAAAAAAGKEAADQAGLLPGVGSVEGTGLTPAETLDALDQIASSPNLTELLRMMGRLERAMRYARSQRVLDAPGEIVGVKTSNDVTKLMPYEMTMMTHPVLKVEFMRRYATHSLLTFETEGEEEAGQGPVVVCRDNSGSMNEQKFLWATAVALAMIRNANRERRDAALIDFDDGVFTPLVFPAGKRVGLAEIVKGAKRRGSGGTNFERPLKRAVEFTDTVNEFKQGDVVLICDGIGPVGPAGKDSACDRLHEKGVRVHCVYVDLSGNQAPAVLGGIADRTDGSLCSISDLQDTEAIRGVAASLA